MTPKVNKDFAGLDKMSLWQVYTQKHPRQCSPCIYKRNGGGRWWHIRWQATLHILFHGTLKHGNVTKYSIHYPKTNTFINTGVKSAQCKNWPRVESILQTNWGQNNLKLLLTLAATSQTIKCHINFSYSIVIFKDVFSQNSYISH